MLRRAILIVTGTAAAVVSAIAYHPPELAQVSKTNKPSMPTQSQGITQPQTKIPAQKEQTPKNQSSTNIPSTETKSNSIVGDFTGDRVQTKWGPVQVKISVTNGSITSAEALAFPNGDRRSLSISQQAIPYLIQQTLGVISSSEVMGVSRATVTSDGWRFSLQSAIDKAGL